MEQSQTQTNSASGSVHASLPLLAFLLVLVALLVTAFVAWINYLTSQQAAGQLLQAQQQYEQFVSQQSRLARFDKSFTVRQQYYADFMAALSDSWLSVNRKDRQGLEGSLQRLAKAYYGLEPFLESGGRHYLQKRIAAYHKLSEQLVDHEAHQKGLVLEDKTTLNQMLEDFQAYLYPLLFEPFQESETATKAEEGRADVSNQTHG